MRNFLEMSAKKVAITGASGLLGRQLLRYFTKEGWQCLGLAFTRARDGLVKVDLCRREDVEKVLDDFKPHVIIHSAAERRPDVVSKQPEQAESLNIGATELLTQLSQKHSTFLVYISTDYVFDGTSPPYQPNSPTNPLNTYGKTKRDGEIIVCKYNNSAVLRVPVLYGPVETVDESAVTTLIKSVMNSSQPTKLSDYEIRYPTHVNDVASVCEQLASQQLASPGVSVGIWHCSGNDRLTKYSMAMTMGRVMGLSTEHLVPVKEPSSSSVPRPYNSQLDCSTTRATFPTSQIDFETGIRDVLSSHVSSTM